MSSASVRPLSSSPPSLTLPLTPSQEKANLARIRDNQRRSRARRKEYLQELEARLRQCELHGIEASAEIQMAARKVADENKKLRALLAQHGIRDDTIEAYLQNPATGDASVNGQFGSSSPSVQVLQQLLQTRKTIGVDGNIAVTVNSMPRSRESSLASASTVQSMWEPIHASNTNGRGALQHTSHQFMTPSSTTRSTTSSISHDSSHSVQHHQRLAPVAISRNPSPASNMANHPQMFDLDPQLSQSNPSSYNTHQSAPQQHWQPHSAPQRSSIYTPTTTTSPNLNSCVFAADMITAMSGRDPNDVSADLGCMPGMDCEVDNHLIFNVMDHYTGTSVGL
jgi:hypothetical protein